MAKVPLVVWGIPWGFTTATTTYIPLSTTDFNANSTEDRRYIIYREPGVFSKLFVRITANTITANSTIRTRKNAATSGNLVVTVGSGATGEFEDTTNTDTSTAGDKWVYQVIAGSTGTTLTASIFSCLFEATTNTVSKLTTFAPSTTSTVTLYSGLSGVSSTETVEANVKNRVRSNGTLKNMYVKVNTNSKAGNTPVRIRKNGANGTNVITIGSNATGEFEDTTHSDSVAAGDDVNFAVETSVAGTLAFSTYTIGFETTDDTGWLVACANAALTQAEPVTRYYGLGGPVKTNIANEIETQLKTRTPIILSNLTIHISANAITDISLFKMRVNGADGFSSCSIGSSGTGYFTDSTNWEECDADDLVNYTLVTPAVSGTPTMTIRSMGIITEPFVAANNVVKTMPTETITVGAGTIAELAAKMRPLTTETTSISESRARLAAKNRAIATQTTTIGAGTAVRIKGKQKTLATETITLSDNRTRLGTKLRPIATQSTVLSDSVARVKTPFGGGPADMSEIAAKTYGNKFITKV